MIFVLKKWEKTTYGAFKFTKFIGSYLSVYLVISQISEYSQIDHSNFKLTLEEP